MFCKPSQTSLLPSGDTEECKRGSKGGQKGTVAPGGFSKARVPCPRLAGVGNLFSANGQLAISPIIHRPHNMINLKISLL